MALTPAGTQYPPMTAGPGCVGFVMLVATVMNVSALIGYYASRSPFVGGASMLRWSVGAGLIGVGLGVVSRTPWSRESAYLQAVLVGAALGFVGAGLSNSPGV